MANREHLDLLKHSIENWHGWRKQHPEILPDLSEANLSTANLSAADLSRANLTGTNLVTAHLWRADLTLTNLSRANLTGADLTLTNLSRANLTGANLMAANLGRADLTGADLSHANLMAANLTGANLMAANLTGADLSRATLVSTNCTKAILTDCRIYGISAWDVELQGATQNSLIIAGHEQPLISVDNLKIAQFIYLLLNNQEIRDVIDIVAKKFVLILGRFTLERKKVLDALRDELRQHNYLPILFDFEKPSSRNLTETVSILAHLSRFIIADLTDSRSIPNELRAIIPILRVPVQPLLNILEEPYGMFEAFKDYPWVLPPYRYIDLPTLLATLEEQIIDPAEQKAHELMKL